MARKFQTPEQRRSELRAALAIARDKGMTSEAKQVNALLRDLDRDIKRQAASV